MHTKTLLSTLVALTAFAAAGSAFAGEAEPSYPTAYTSTLTRAEVRAEAIQARAEGRVSTGERSYVALPVGMAKTRAQVQAETLEAIRLGAIDRGEQSLTLTQMQLNSIEMAGLKALAMQVASR